MAKENKTEEVDDSVDEESDAESNDEAEAEEEEADEESADDSEEEADDSEDEAQHSDNKEEIDFDTELDKERKNGKPDLKKAEKAFKERRGSKSDEEENDEDEPVTQADLEKVRRDTEKQLNETRALALARSMAITKNPEKEAELIVEKWKNRTFPSNLSLNEQIEEAFAITHHKRLVSERNEAARALKGKNTVSKDGSTNHRDSQGGGGKPKISSVDESAIIAAGFALNPKLRRYEKKLSNGDTLVRDSKTGQTHIEKKSR